MGSLLHEHPHHVVSDEVQANFLMDHCGTQAAQNVQAQNGLDLAEVKFDSPALEVEEGEFCYGICEWIQERRNQDHVLSPGAWERNAVVNLAQGQGHRQRVELRGGLVLGSLWPLPGHEAISASQAFAPAQIERSGVAQAHDRVHLALEKGGHVEVGTKSAISEDDGAGFELAQELAKESDFINVEASAGDMEEGAAGQGEEGHQLHHGKTAAGLLAGRLGIEGLIGGRIRHGEVGSIDYENIPIPPPVASSDIALKAGGDGLMDGLQGSLAKARPGLAISARARRDGARPLCWSWLTPGLDFADDLPARAIGAKNLSQESPESDSGTKEALSAIGALWGGGEELVGDE